MSNGAQTDLHPLSKIEGGWRIRETEHWYVEVIKTTFNWRIVVTARGEEYRWDNGWCYPMSHNPLLEVFARCYTFEPEQGQEPEGWIKEVGSQRRACASLYPFVRNGPHQGYVASCPDCGRVSPNDQS